jgi:hypothetical protein
LLCRVAIAVWSIWFPSVPPENPRWRKCLTNQSPIARASQINGLCSYGIGDEVACALLLLGHIQELKQERMCDLHGSAIHRSASIDGYDYGAFAEAWLVLLCAIALLHWRFGGELLELVGSEAMVEDVLGVVFG